MKQSTRHGLLGLALLACVTAVAVIDARPAEARAFSAPRVSMPMSRPAVRVQAPAPRRSTASTSSSDNFTSAASGAVMGAVIGGVIMNSVNGSSPIEGGSSIKKVCQNAEGVDVSCPEEAKQ